MSPPKGNFVYYLNDGKKNKTELEHTISDKKLQKLLEALSKHTLKEKTPEFQELESLLQNSLNQNENQDHETKTEKDEHIEEGGTPLTKLLKEKGYLREEKKWLTNKGFFEIGGKILHDVMKDLNSAEVGLHETKLTGSGNVLIDTTKKFEPGNDIKFLSVPQTILNTIKRISKLNHKIDFPIVIDLDDLEEFETLEDVRAAIVYCIDLSSTMKYSIGKIGTSRIEAAKKALWGLYALNKKFFPNDSISIVGFGSMASLIDPDDIHQKNEIISDKPYSNFYTPDKNVISKVKKERDMELDINKESMVYLCYRYKKVDPKINDRTVMEAKKCKREGIDIDTIVVSDEEELLKYAQDLEKTLKGKTYHINQENMDEVLVHDYLTNTRKVLSSQHIW